MRFQIVDKQNGILDIKFKGESRVQLPVNPVNFIEWYPLSMAYEFKFNTKSRTLRLMRTTSQLPHLYNDLGISGTVLEAPHEFDLVIPEIKKDNMKIVEVAKDYGLPVPTEYYTYHMVDQGLQKLGLIYKEVNQLILQDYISSLEPTALKVFMLKDRDTQLDKALIHLSQDKDDTYSKLGQLSVMLVTMKKLSRK